MNWGKLPSADKYRSRYSRIAQERHQRVSHREERESTECQNGREEFQRIERKSARIFLRWLVIGLF